MGILATVRSPFANAARRIRRLPCSCRGRAPTEPLQKGYRFIWRDWIGVTLGWSCHPEIAIASGYQCEQCGTVYEVSDGYIPRLGTRDHTGWPLTLDGKRMPLESDRIYREREWPKAPALSIAASPLPAVFGVGTSR